MCVYIYVSVFVREQKSWGEESHYYVDNTFRINSAVGRGAGLWILRKQMQNHDELN